MSCGGDLRKAAAALLGLLAVLATGCAKRDRGGSRDVPVIDLAILESFPRPGPNAQGDLIWKAVDIETGPDGRIYVADVNARQIHVFDPSGKPILSFGRKGQGPGEFDYPHAVAVTATRLFVKDRGNRILTFDTAGLFSGQFRLSRPIASFCVRDGRTFYGCPIFPVDPDRRAAALGDPAVVVLDGSGAVIDSFGAPVPLIKDMNILNTARVALDKAGGVIVAYEYIPLVRRYSRSGRLLNENTLPYDFIAEYRKENERTYGTSSYFLICPDIKSDGERIYVMCLDRSVVRFLELGLDLGLRAIFRVDLAPLGEDVRSRSFAIGSKDGKPRFYLLDSGDLLNQVYVAGPR
jgi:hypothetical protein